MSRALSVVVTILLSVSLASCSQHEAQVMPSSSSGLVSPQTTEYLEPMTVAAPSEIFVAVALPIRNRADLESRLARISDPSSPEYGHFVSRQYVADNYAPRQADLQQVSDDLDRAGFKTTIGVNAVFASAPTSTVASYFGTTLRGTQYTDVHGKVTTQAVAVTPLHLNGTLTQLRAHVLGLEDIPPAQTFSETIHTFPPRFRPSNTEGLFGPYYPPDLKQAYRFPSYATAQGTGVEIAIVNDASVKPSDISEFASLAVGSPIHFTTSVLDGGGKGDPTEATLDIEQAGGIAPGSEIDLLDIPALSDVYIYDAYEAAFNNPKITIVNSSFGSCEVNHNTVLGLQDLLEFDMLLEEGSVVGMTWVAASGDYSSTPCGRNLNQTGVFWPASDPNVVAVGGTDLETTHTPGSYNSAYVAQAAYEDSMGDGEFWGSGGGYSGLYLAPSWQNGFVTRNARGVPDLSLHMGCCPVGAAARASYDSSDWAYVNGQWSEIIGTSAAAPDIAGLLALRIQVQHKVLGDVHYWLYNETTHATIMRRGIPGNNGYPTTTGYWDPVLGLGTPYANTFAGTTTVAGIPGSASNPGR